VLLQREGGLDLFSMAICPAPKTNKLPGAVSFMRWSLNALDGMFEKNRELLAPALSPEDAGEITEWGNATRRDEFFAVSGPMIQRAPGVIMI